MLRHVGFVKLRRLATILQSNYVPSIQGPKRCLLKRLYSIISQLRMSTVPRIATTPTMPMTRRTIRIRHRRPRHRLLLHAARCFAQRCPQRRAASKRAVVLIRLPSCWVAGSNNHVLWICLGPARRRAVGRRCHSCRLPHPIACRPASFCSISLPSPP